MAGDTTAASTAAAVDTTSTIISSAANAKDINKNNSQTATSKQDTAEKKDPNNKNKNTTRKPRAPLSEDVKLSKALSSTLRHNAAKEGLKLRPDGYALVEDLLSLNKYKSQHLTFSKLQHLVSSNDKQRYSLLQETETGKWYIRANQGHSIDVKVEMEELREPGDLVHGSYYAFLEEIVRSGGLKKGGRVHVHLAPAGNTGAAPVPAVPAGPTAHAPAPAPTPIISGMRTDAEIIFLIDGNSASAAGMKFLRSENGVVLTEGNEEGMLPMRFVRRVVDRKRGLGTVWDAERGFRVVVPEEWKRVPFGKGRGGGRGGKGWGEGGWTERGTGGKG
ncbi:KptA family-domain-containing protein [Pyronema omphalodes]|nr:KptA family-domain-containing protein [Pyronema omphalodes]